MATRPFLVGINDYAPVGYRLCDHPKRPHIVPNGHPKTIASLEACLEDHRYSAGLLHVQFLGH